MLALHRIENSECNVQKEKNSCWSGKENIFFSEHLSIPFILNVYAAIIRICNYLFIYLITGSPHFTVYNSKTEKLRKP